MSNIEIPDFPVVPGNANVRELPDLSLEDMASWYKRAEVNIEKINALVSFVDHSSESNIDYDPATHEACIAAIDNWTEPDAISVQFAASFSGNPESLEFITRLRTFLDQSKPTIFNLLLKAPNLSAKCLSVIGIKLLNELDPKVHVTILVIIPSQRFANAFIQWRKREFRCNHFFMSNLGRIELSSAFWDSFQLCDDLTVVTLEDIDGEGKARQIFERFYRPQSSVQLLRLGKIRNVSKEFFHEGLNLTGVFDTLPLGLQIKLDGENLYTSMRVDDRSNAIEDRIKTLNNTDDIYYRKHLKMLFIGTGGKASGKTSTIRSLWGKSFKPDLPPTQCASVVAQVQVPTDQEMEANATSQWTFYSMEKAILRGYDAVSLNRSGALFVIYDFATNTQLFTPVLNNSCIVMLCINLMDMKRDPTKELLKLVDALELITSQAPDAPVILIGTHADEYPTLATMRDLDRQLFIRIREVGNKQVQPNAAQKLFFFPIENSRGEKKEQLDPIRFAVGGLVRKAQETIDQRNDAARELLANSLKSPGAYLDALVALKSRPGFPLPHIDEPGRSAHAYFLNMLMKTDLNTFLLERNAFIGKAMGLTFEDTGFIVSYYKEIGLIVYVSIADTDNFTLNRVMVLKPNWLYQSFAKLIYNPTENTKVYNVPFNLVDDVDNYERTGQATKKVLKELLDGMKDYEKEYVIELAMHWNLMTQIADSPDDAEYVVYGMIPHS